MVVLLMLSAAFAAGARPVSPAYEGNCQSPTWSRDGAKLAYEVNYHDRKVIEQHIYWDYRLRVEERVTRTLQA